MDPQGDVIFDGDSTDDRPLGDVEQYQDAKPLAEELIDTLIDLLFFCNFTIPLPAQSHGSVHLAIWQSGVGCNSPMGSTRECENNRLEILRLLLTLSSKSMYTPASSFKNEYSLIWLLTIDRYSSCPRGSGRHVYYYSVSQAACVDLTLLPPEHRNVSLRLFENLLLTLTDFKI